MEDRANIVLSKDETVEFLRNLNNPPESVRQARRTFLEEAMREGLQMEELKSVVDMDEYRPHVVSEVICVKCSHRWISVRPAITLLKDLECPNCGKGAVIETGQILDPDEK